MTCTNLNTIIRKERVVADVTAACRILVLLHATYCLGIVHWIHLT